MTRYMYDTEFLEDGSTIALISIALVAEDGREYYAISEDAPLHRLGENAWLMANVVPSLPIAVSSGGQLVWDGTMPDHEAVKPRTQIADEVRSFVLGDHPEELPHVELWADYGAYDHVALCQLWGTMMDLPTGIPMFTRDIQQEAGRLGYKEGDTRLPWQTAGLHNALSDARHAKVLVEFLEKPDAPTA